MDFKNCFEILNQRMQKPCDCAPPTTEDTDSGKPVLPTTSSALDGKISMKFVKPGNSSSGAKPGPGHHHHDHQKCSHAEHAVNNVTDTTNVDPADLISVLSIAEKNVCDGAKCASDSLETVTAENTVLNSTRDVEMEGNEDLKEV